MSDDWGKMLMVDCGWSMTMTGKREYEWREMMTGGEDDLSDD